MVPIYRKKYPEVGETGTELILGWPTWDSQGRDQQMSVKLSYKDKRGRISRGCPEVAIDVLIEMVLFAIERKQLNDAQINKLKEGLRTLAP